MANNDMDELTIAMHEFVSPVGHDWKDVRVWTITSYVPASVDVSLQISVTI